MCPFSGLWGGVLDCDSQFTILSPPSFDQRWRGLHKDNNIQWVRYTLCPAQE